MNITVNKKKGEIIVQREERERKIYKASEFYYKAGRIINEKLGHKLIRTGLSGVGFYDYNFQYCLYEKERNYRLIWEHAEYQLVKKRKRKEKIINECDAFNEFQPIRLVLNVGKR